MFQRHHGAFENRRKAAGVVGGGAVPGTEPGALDSIPSPSKAKKDEGSHLGGKSPYYPRKVIQLTRGASCVPCVQS